MTTERKCAVCGCDISHRNKQAKICLSKECREKKYGQEHTCRFCGKPFQTLHNGNDCGSEECFKRRQVERAANARKTINHRNAGRPATVYSAIKPDNPDAKYIKVYSVVQPKVIRGHAGTNFQRDEDSASRDCAWLFKGRKPEKPRPVDTTFMRVVKKRGWKQVHKEQFALHKKSKGATI